MHVQRLPNGNPLRTSFYLTSDLKWPNRFPTYLASKRLSVVSTSAKRFATNNQPYLQYNGTC